MKTKEITDENSIRLIIKKCFADEIKAGTKVREYRDISNFYLNRLVWQSKTPKEGYNEIKDDNGKPLFVKYKKVKYIIFQIGYTRNTFICECIGLYWSPFATMKTLNENDLLYPDYRKENPKPLPELLKDEFEDVDWDDDFDGLIIFSLGKILKD